MFFEIIITFIDKMFPHDALFLTLFRTVVVNITLMFNTERFRSQAKSYEGQN